MKKTKCTTCQGDKKIMSATGDSKYPLRAIPCPSCQKKCIVRVYRNLRHGKAARPLYSILYKGRVISRRFRVLLRDCTFVVRTAGRQKVLTTKHKNVHAFVVGELVTDCFGIDANGKNFPERVHYNPFKAGYFYNEQGDKLISARGVLLNETGISACYAETEFRYSPIEGVA